MKVDKKMTRVNGALAAEATDGNLSSRVERLIGEKECLLNELETAYEGLAQALEISRREADAAYGELRSKINILERKVFELISLNNIGKAVTSILGLDELLEVILAKICELIEVDAALVALNGEDNGLEITHVRGLPLSCVGKPFALDVEVACKVALKNNEPVLIGDLDKSHNLSVFKLESRMKSAVAVPLRTRKEDVGMLVLNSTSEQAFTEDHALLLSTFGAQAAVAIVNAKLYKDLKEMLVGVMFSFSAAIEAKDPYTEGHSSRVSRYAVAIGQKLGMTGTSLEELRNAGLIHDIGKIGVAEAIIRKTGKLDDIEWDAMRLHPLHGENIVAPIPFLASVLPGVRWHHERYDGTGYPDGIANDKIPMMARILSVADAYDAITSRRPYREPRSPEQARDEIRKYSGRQFDPRVVRAFEDAFDSIVKSNASRRNPVEIEREEKGKVPSEELVEANDEH